MFEILSFSAAPTGWTNYYYDGEVLESEPMPGWLTVRYASDPANAGEVLVEPGSFAKAADPDGTWGGASVRPQRLSPATSGQPPPVSRSSGLTRLTPSSSLPVNLPVRTRGGHDGEANPD
jgi:hypothetical protein